MIELRQAFIRNLKHYRKQKGVRQLDLALEIGKSSNYINSVENGKYFPPPETIERIAAFLEIDPMQLFDKREGGGKKSEVVILRKNLRSAEKRLKSEIAESVANVFETLGGNQSSEVGNQKTESRAIIN